MTIASQVYLTELFELGHGVPLYDPHPADEYDKVRVFDVGYIDRDFGRYHRVFNASLPQNHQINLQYGTPADFELFQCGGRAPASFSSSPLPAGAMHSSHVKVLGSDVGVSGYVYYRWYWY